MPKTKKKDADAFEMPAFDKDLLSRTAQLFVARRELDQLARADKRASRSKGGTRRAPTPPKNAEPVDVATLEAGEEVQILDQKGRFQVRKVDTAKNEVHVFGGEPNKAKARTFRGEKVLRVKAK